jgi:hypothetical protein
MKFMMMVKAGAAYEAGVPPSQELIEAIGQINQEMIEKGMLVDMGGLLPSRTGARVRVAGGNLTVIDGPFAETKELVGGYAILRVPTRDEAIALGRRFMKIHADVLGPSYEGELEIRQLAEAPGT